MAYDETYESKREGRGKTKVALDRSTKILPWSTCDITLLATFAPLVAPNILYSSLMMLTLTLTNRLPSREAEKSRRYRRACALDTGPEADARRKRQREQTRERQKRYRERHRTKRAQSNHLIVLDDDNTHDAPFPPSLPPDRHVADPAPNDVERATSPVSGAGAGDTETRRSEEENGK